MESQRRFEPLPKIIARLPRDVAQVRSRLGVALTRISAVETGAAAVGVWTTWTPSYTNLTPGSGSASVGRFCQIGDLIHYYWQVTLGTTPTVGDVRVSLPVTAISVPAQTVLGHSSLVDTSAGSTIAGLARQASTTTMQIALINTGTHAHNPLTSTTPFTWASGDVIISYGFYEAA